MAESSAIPSPSSPAVLQRNVRVPQATAPPTAERSRPRLEASAFGRRRQTSAACAADGRPRPVFAIRLHYRAPSRAVEAGAHRRAAAG
eukprot:scaffold1895_cov123-Isochrysis_galbana.AAC.3